MVRLLRQEAPALLGEVQEDRARLEEGDGAASGAVVVHDGWNLVVRADGEIAGLELLAATDAHPVGAVREAGLLEHDVDLLPVRRGGGVEVDHGLVLMVRVCGRVSSPNAAPITRPGECGAQPLPRTSIRSRKPSRRIRRGGSPRGLRRRARRCFRSGRVEPNCAEPAQAPPRGVSERVPPRLRSTASARRTRGRSTWAASFPRVTDTTATNFAGGREASASTRASIDARV